MSRQTHQCIESWGFSIDIRLLSLNAFNFNRKRIAYRMMHDAFSFILCISGTQILRTWRQREGGGGGGGER